MLTPAHHNPDLAVLRIGLRCVDPGVRHKGNHLLLEELFRVLRQGHVFGVPQLDIPELKPEVRELLPVVRRHVVQLLQLFLGEVLGGDLTDPRHVEGAVVGEVQVGLGPGLDLFVYLGNRVNVRKGALSIRGSDLPPPYVHVVLICFAFLPLPGPVEEHTEVLVHGV